MIAFGKLNGNINDKSVSRSIILNMGLMIVLLAFGGYISAQDEPNMPAALIVHRYYFILWS